MSTKISVVGVPAQRRIFNDAGREKRLTNQSERVDVFWIVVGDAGSLVGTLLYAGRSQICTWGAAEMPLPWLRSQVPITYPGTPSLWHPSRAFLS